MPSTLQKGLVIRDHMTYKRSRIEITCLDLFFKYTEGTNISSKCKSRLTWINLLKIIKNWNAIIILIFQFFSCVQYLLLVIRCENTAPVSWYVNRCFSPINRIFFMTKRNLKESMLRILGGGGISINIEFVKNAMRRLASTLVGTSIADSLIVKSKWSRSICKHNINSIKYQSDI